MKQSKQEKLSSAIKEFIASNKYTDDYMKLFITFNQVIKPADGLVWSEVEQVIDDALKPWIPEIGMKVVVIDEDDCGGIFKNGETGTICAIDDLDSFKIENRERVSWYCRACTRPISE